MSLLYFAIIKLMKTLFKKIGKDKIQCLACAHYCQIFDGNFGICGTRKNINGKLVSLAYGRPVAINVDPIEKKPLYHFLPKTKILSIGTFGCNFSCQFCQNWQMSQISKNNPEIEKLFEDLKVYSPREIVKLVKENNCPSIAYTYNEPVIFIEYAHDIAKLAKKAGIKNVFVSNGFWSEESFEYISPFLDAANIDLKSADDEFYRKYSGARLAPILETIRQLHKAKIHLELTTLIIPGLNDDEKNLKNIAKFIAKLDKNIPWHISRFFPCYKLKNLPPTPISTLKTAEKIGRSAGLKNIYIGNV